MNDETKIRRGPKKGTPSPLKGRKLSEEHRNKISKSNKGRKHTDEARRKISESYKKRTNFNYGKPNPFKGVKL